MADISLQSLFDEIRPEFGAGPTSNEFEVRFIGAVNSAISHINTNADLSPKLGIALSLDNSVALDELNFKHVLANGVRYYLVQGGFRQRGDPRRVPSISDLLEVFELGVASVQNDGRNTDQETATNNIFGLGATPN